MIKKCPTESQEQQKLVMKLRWFHPDIQFFAIPNGGKRNPGEARKLVLEGVEPGTPDIFIAEPKNGSNGLFLELKRSIKSLSNTSEKQIEKHKALKSKGYQVKVCYGCDDAYQTFLQYIKN